MSGLIDTHCHLDMLPGSVTEALAGARAAGLEAIVTIGIDLSSSRQAVALARTHECVSATVGLHPHDAHLWDEALALQFERLAADPAVVAIGECGLDYYRDRAPREDQRRAFVGQIDLARKLGKPLVVHIREAAADGLELLARHAQGLTVVLHCFSQPDALEECVRHGYYLSFAGNVTYKNADDLRRAARTAPDDLLILETDAPFLSPVPFRGKPNLPERVLHTHAVIAEVRGQDGRELAALTSANARRAFGLGKG